MVHFLPLTTTATRRINVATLSRVLKPGEAIREVEVLCMALIGQEELHVTELKCSEGTRVGV